MSLDEATLRALFDKSQGTNPDKMRFTDEESSRFKKSFEDPEFRKLFADYMDELQDPKNREETEAYITQLEGEQKVPEGKELIRPEPSFVAKSFKITKNNTADKEKVFLNIVQSDKINVPSKTDTPQGTCWSVPYSLGPPHMEKDKNGDNAPCFDCCFHPDAIRLGMRHKEFKDLLVTTAMEGVEKLYQQQGQDITINREFHIVKGVEYKQGPVPTMMIAIANKDNWKVDDSKPNTGKESVLKTASAASSPKPPSQSNAGSSSPRPPTPPSTDATKKKTSSGLSMKKGFLSSSKAAIYGDKLTTIRPASKRDQPVDGSTSKASNISLVDRANTEASGFNDLNVPTAATTVRKGKSGEGLIQEVKDGERSIASSSNAPDNTGTEKKTGSTAPVGMKAVSTTKRVSATVQREAVAATALGSTEAAMVDNADPPIATSESGLEVPRYTMKERGHVSMGDFESMNTTARSSRPSELIYRIELPRITRASQIVLDIAERQLNLSYPEMYNLTVKLPYPVMDNKGTAKYDKATKSLIVTLPVRPPALVSTTLDSVDRGISSATSATEDLDDNVVGDTEISPKKCTPAKKASSGHSRWVEGAAAEATTPSASDSASASTPGAGSGLSLHDEIKRQAEMAVREAKLAASTTATTTTVATTVTSVTPKLPEIVSSECTEQSGAAFIPAAKFEGRRAGYFFKRGEQGIGYYNDAKLSSSVQKPAESASSAPVSTVVKTNPPTASEVVAIAHDIFPFVCRQTKQALAVIVQVPHIDPASVNVTFLEYAVHVCFRAFADATAASENKLRAVQYGAVLRLPADLCPGGLDVTQCRHDAASQNMALVLTKRLPQYWAKSTGTLENKTDAQIETKSGFSDEDAQNILQVEVYVKPPASEVVAVPSVEASNKVEKNAEETKAVRALENAMHSLQFSSSEALFELD